VRAQLEERGAHPRERFGDPPHRPAAQRFVAGQGRREGAGGEQPHHQTRRRPAVAAVERLRRRAPRIETPAAHAHLAAVRGRVRHVAAERAEHGGRAAAVLPRKQPAQPALAARGGRQHQRAMGDRLVAGNANVPAYEERHRLRFCCGRCGRERTTEAAEGALEGR
jgi:hypothetical protein